MPTEVRKEGGARGTRGQQLGQARHQRSYMIATRLCSGLSFHSSIHSFIDEPSYVIFFFWL